MRKFWYAASIALISMVCLASCSDDDAPNWEGKIPSATYTDANGLTLNVNGAPMVGKTAKIDVKGDKATVTLNSSFNLAEIPDLPQGLGTVIEGPGVLPGSAETVLNVTLEETQGGAAFSGKDETQFCTFEYNGKATESSIEINITNVVLKDKSLVGSYRLLPYNVNEDWESDEYGTVYSEPIYVKWESTASLDLFGSPMKPADLIKLLMTMPLLEDMTVRIPDMLCANLQNVRLGETGDITATYLDNEADTETPTYIQSPANIAQYIVESNGNMRLWLNPQAIIKDATRADTGIDINNLLGNIIVQLSPMLKDGVPLRYRVDGANTTIYLDTQTILPLLKTNVSPLLRNEEVINRLVAIIAADESMASLAPMIPAILRSAADVIDGTTTLEVGLNLTTAAN